MESPTSPARSLENSVSEQPVNEIVYEYRADIIPASSTICDAAPSEDGSTANYSAFNSNQVENTVKQYNNIKVTHSVDARNRDFYFFDDFGMKPMTIVVFETPSGDLLSVNDIVLPLDEFLDISHIKQANVSAKSESADLREIMTDSGRYGTVLCKTHDDKEFTIPNSNVKLVMMAISILSEDYGNYSSDSSDSTCEEEYESDEEETEEDEKKPIQNQDEHVGLIRRLVRWLW